MFRRADDTPELHAPSLPEAARGVLFLVSGLTVAGAVLGGALALAWPQAYVATSEVAVSPTMQLSAPAGYALVENQLRMLRSRTMLDAAVDRLNLMADTEFNGEKTGVAGLVSDVSQLFTADGASIAEQRRHEAVTRLDKAINAHRVANSSVVAISATSSDPAKSALIANTLSDLFLAELGGASPTAAAKLAELQAELTAAERAVAEFRGQRGLHSSEQEMARLDAQLAAATARVSALDARAAALRGDAAIDMIATASVSPGGGMSALEEARIRHADLRQKVATLSGKLGPRHPDLINAQAELDAAQREMENEARRASATLQDELAKAVREQQALAARAEDIRTGETAADMQKLRELERAADLRRAAYEEAVRASAPPAASQGGRVILPAEPPLQAAGPTAATLSLAGALGGMLAGLGFAGWRSTTGADEPWEYDGSDAHRDAVFDPGYEAKETDEMYPYPHYAHATPQPEAHSQPQQQHVAPAAHAVPGWYPPAAVAHDPWAHMRAYTAPAPHHAPVHPQQPVHTVVYVPVPAAHQAQPLPRSDAFGRDFYAERRTDAAIEEIRQSLRALREAIEDFADDRYGD